MKGRTGATFASPITLSRQWLTGVTFPPERPLINVSQAAPVAPPPAAMLDEMARIVREDPDAHRYGPDLGLPALRAALAARWQQIHGGTVTAAQVAITSGANQAYCSATAMLCAEGDAVILPSPWYFNHRMWNDIAGIDTIALHTGDDLIPDVAAAAALITPRTRAIVLVTPNNPGGVEYPRAVVHAFYALAKARGIALILDETYRDFDSRNAPAHGLFVEEDWDQTLIHIYSFSKAYHIPGHRIGALASSPARLDEVEKFIDSVTICPSQLGQRAALWGLTNLDGWLADERAEILSRRAAVIAGFAPLAAQGWKLLGCGAYFAYVEHPFAMPSDTLAQRLVQEAGVLMLPGTMFTPPGDASGQRQLRIAFANVDTDGIAALFKRLLSYQP
ncbi:Aspartate aminotransferase [Ketogulonicigenium robustum]|uniref:aspartate transaminase n=1 Tax=Ketogulonicigenium robustum TaxID=92947 RepID=A0A1W6NYB1_9RHOB|nr:aminotransferase [Ketogulonicigenium robustum]ARO14222.1 Aspartate aminotransferase [Ketogulonicigenium robustum]